MVTITWLIASVVLGVRLGDRMFWTAHEKPPTILNYVATTLVFAVAAVWFVYIARDPGARCDSVYVDVFVTLQPAAWIGVAVAVAARIRRRTRRSG